MNKEIVNYRISEDGVGLLGYFEDGTFYHIHSDEMTSDQKIIYTLLKERDIK